MGYHLCRLCQFRAASCGRDPLKAASFEPRAHPGATRVRTEARMGYHSQPASSGDAASGDAPSISVARERSEPSWQSHSFQAIVKSRIIAQAVPIRCDRQVNQCRVALRDGLIKAVERFIEPAC